MTLEETKTKNAYYERITKESKTDGVIKIIDTIMEAATAFEYLRLEFPNFPAIREIENIDIEILSEVCFQLDIRPIQEDGKYTAVYDCGISKVILKSK